MDSTDIRTRATRQLLVMLRAARTRESLEAFYAIPSPYASQLTPLPPFNPPFTIDELKAELATREHIPNQIESKRMRKERNS